MGYVIPVCDGMGVWQNSEVARAPQGVDIICTHTFMHVFFDRTIHSGPAGHKLCRASPL